MKMHTVSIERDENNFAHFSFLISIILNVNVHNVST